MFPRRPHEGASRSGGGGGFPPLAPPFTSLVPPLLLLVLLAAPPPSLADSPPLLSLLVPWAADGAPGTAVGGALESLGEAPYLSTQGDERRFQAFLDSDRMQGLTGGPATPEEWESPKNPDLFLLTEVGGGNEEGRRRRDAGAQEAPRATESAAHRMKRNGGFVSGGSRIRTGGNGGGFAGSSGMRVSNGFGTFGPGRMGTQMGGRMNEGPSLSIVNPLDVLRQRLLLEIARRRMRESEDQIQANRELLKSIGKREVGEGREVNEEDARGGGPGNDKAHAQTPSSM